MWKISENNHSDLSFALGCVYCQAINLDEFKKWVGIVMRDNSFDDLPMYIYDLIDFNLPLFHIHKIIGFPVINNLSNEDEYALYGIAYLRKKEVFDPPVYREKAIECLIGNNMIYEKFKMFFPFIYLPEG